MIKYVIGDIIEDDSDCLVNTVNLEGFMGKGIAYQFKLKFPTNERAYVDACRSRRIDIGKVFLFEDNGRLIANFPTKDKWRQPSQYSYVEDGLKDLQNLITTRSIRSIAVPPLGCGNGGLEWPRVKALIEEYLEPISDQVAVKVYEPSKYYKTTPTVLPKLNASHLILMRLKSRLDKFNKLRVQKAAYFLNLFSGSDYFKFDEHKFGPYSHSIDILSTQIKEFQDYYKATTVAAEEIAYKNLISETVEAKVRSFEPDLLRASNFTNSIKSDLELELCATIVDLVKKNAGISRENLVRKIDEWPKAQPERISEISIEKVLNSLIHSGILILGLMGFEINNEYIKSAKMLSLKRAD